MRSEATRRQLTVQSGEVSLAGTLWLPATGVPAAVVLMHPGSGPSDRHNDVFFPPIREHLLDAGFAVASFDKRGVGGSTGRWLDAAIVDQRMTYSPARQRFRPTKSCTERRWASTATVRAHRL
jgi:pimeloyl-ACP methyl ester carboxylesterase